MKMHMLISRPAFSFFVLDVNVLRTQFKLVVATDFATNFEK